MTINPAPTGPVCDLTPSEMFDTLTGFDEIAVQKMFGRPITDYGRKGRSPNGSTLVRALVFVHRRRAQDEKDPVAFNAAMSLTMGEVQSYFAPEPDDEADTDEGPDDGDLEQPGDPAGKAQPGA